MSAKTESLSLDCSPDAVIAAEGAGRLLHANPRARSLFGLADGEPAALTIEDLFPDWKTGRTAPAAAASPFVTAARRRDGSRFAAEVAVGRAAAGPGEAGVIVVSIREREPEASGGRAAVATEAALRQQREFFALFNHDVRQSLQAIQFLSETLAASAPETVQVITEILGSVRRLLDTLLRFNDAGTALPSAAPCALGELLQKLRRELAPVAERKGLVLLVEDTAVELHTDPVLLRELLQNLLANAIRYTQEGEVRLSCRATSAEVHIDVVDTGVGMSEQQLRRAFAAPAAGRADAGPEGGFGLGLAIVGRLADALGCDVDASSTPGRGSAFTVTMPRTSGRFEALRVEAQQSAGPAEPASSRSSDSSSNRDG